MPVVLVVDDSPVDRARAGGLLKKSADLVPAYAANGREALAAIAAHAPDIVVSDLQMPEMDGLELVGAVRRQFAALPIILMTAHGSEETAVQALRKGAANYVAKRNLAAELVDTVLNVRAVTRGGRDTSHHLHSVTETQTRFELGSDIAGVPSLIGQLEANLTRMQLVDETGLIRVAVALREALMNAIYHGNLELTSELLEVDESEYVALAERRRQQEPYARRRVHLLARETRTEATYVIGDEGRGFDPSAVPDPTEDQNLDRRTGRGLFLIRTFMDEVRHNAIGNEITLVKRRDRPATSGEADPEAPAGTGAPGGGVMAGKAVDKTT